MRRTLIPIAFMLLAGGSMAAPAAQFAEGSAQACWLSAFQAMDADAVAACYAPDAVLWIPGGPMAKGRQAIHDGYAGFFAAFTIKDVAITEMGHETMGDAMTSWGTYTIVSVARNGGAESTETGRYADLSRRIDGHWLYVMDHASDDPPPPAVAAAAAAGQ
jgi:uncharacterized protein (TIGR02246 family)